MWFLIQLLVLLGSVGSFGMLLYTDKKSSGFVRAVARTTIGSTSSIVAKVIGFAVLIVVFGRLGWYPLAAAVGVSLSSLLWALSSLEVIGRLRVMAGGFAPPFLFFLFLL